MSDSLPVCLTSAALQNQLWAMRTLIAAALLDALLDGPYIMIMSRVSQAELAALYSRIAAALVHSEIL